MPRSQRSTSPSRRGMTFIEVTLAVALLAILSSTVFGAFSYLTGRQRLEQQKLGAAEVANRLMLQYLDDDDSMPAGGLPVEHGSERFRWNLIETPVKITPARPANPQSAATEAPSRAGPSALERTKQVTIRVWLSEESGGSFSLDSTFPNVTLTRIVYPSGAGRNPDSFANLLKNHPEKIRERLGLGEGSRRDKPVEQKNAGSGKGRTK